MTEPGWQVSRGGLTSKLCRLQRNVDKEKPVVTESHIATLGRAGLVIKNPTVAFRNK